MTEISQDIQKAGQENARGSATPTLRSQVEAQGKSKNAERRTPLPKFQLFIVSLIQFAEPITAIVIYPFVNQFVRDTGVTHGDDKKTGYYAGVIESAFFFAEAATVFHWGWLSDRFGRRPVLLIGPLGLTFAMLKFGYSTSFWQMVWSRCMQGVFNGNIGVSKTVVMELTDATNIGDAIAIMPLMWSIGTTIAPTIGGVLSNPAARWPNVFGKLNLLKEHPYLLPCIVASLVSFFSFVIGFLGLKETHPSIISKSKMEIDQVIGKDSSMLGATPADPLLCHGEVPAYGATSSTPCSPASSEDPPQPFRKVENTNTPPSVLSFMLASRTLRMLWINFVFLTLTDMCYAALVPLIWSTSIKNGGLGLTPYQIGLTMGVWGFVNAFVQMNLLGKIVRKYGPSRVYKSAYPCYLVAFLTYPVSIHLARRNGAVGFGACISIMIQLSCQFAFYFAGGSIHVSIAESTPKTILGSINGLFQMSGSLMRTLAPTLASSLFSFSLQAQILGGNLVYVVLLAITLIGVGLSLTLPNCKGEKSND